jgi:hypothetical protein
MNARDAADSLTGDQARDAVCMFLQAVQMIDQGGSTIAFVRALQHACTAVERMVDEVPDRTLKKPQYRIEAEKTRLRGIVKAGGAGARRAEVQLMKLNKAAA